MKKAILSTAVLATVLISCNSNKSEEKSDKMIEATNEEIHDHSHDQHAETSEKEPSVDTTTTIVKTQSDFSIDEIVRNYLKLKNSLTKDDSKGAAKAAKALYESFNKANQNSIKAKSKKEYLEIADDAKEHAEHINDNSGDIEHQREHFAILSKDLNDLIKLFGTKQKLYLDFCPMYDEGDGAVWISETKEIKNPYYGQEMPTCGSIKKEYNK